jgi:hypothetical protein
VHPPQTLKPRSLNCHPQTTHCASRDKGIADVEKASRRRTGMLFVGLGRGDVDVRKGEDSSDFIMEILMRNPHDVLV